MKIGYKLVLIIGVLIVIGVAISASAYYIIIKQAIEERIEAQLETVAVLKENHINDFIEEKGRDMNSIAAEEAIVNRFIKILKTEDGQEKNGMDYKEDLKQLLTERITNRKNFFELSILDLDGKTVVSTDETQIGKFKSAEDYLTEGKKGIYLQNFYYDLELQQPVMAIATPIKSGDEIVLGVLVGRLNLKWISEIMIERSGLGKTGETYLVNKFNLLVSKSRFVEGIEFNQVIHTVDVKDCLKGNNGYLSYDDYRGSSVIGVYKWNPEIELCLIAKMDHEEAFECVGRLKEMIILTSIVIIILVVILGHFFSKTITKPIANLRDAAIEIGKGKLNTKIKSETSDEMGELAASFNRMTRDLKRSRKELESYSNTLEKKVKDRTKQLELKNEELGKFNKLAVGRELKMIELKKKIKEIGKKPEKR